MDKTNKVEIISNIEKGDSILIKNLTERCNKLFLVLEVKNDEIRLKRSDEEVMYSKEYLTDSENIEIELIPMY